MFVFSDEVELWIVMTSMVSGALMYTVMVANAAAMMTNVDAPAKIYKNKVTMTLIEHCPAPCLTTMSTWRAHTSPALAQLLTVKISEINERANQQTHKLRVLYYEAW